MTAEGGDDNGAAADRDERHAQYSGVWVLMVMLLVGVGLVMGQRAPFVLAACLLTVIPVAWLWKRLALSHVSYERQFDKRCAFPGETFGVTVRITNRKLLPLTWIELNDEVPSALPLTRGALVPTHVPQVGHLRTVLAVRWYERVVRRHQLACAARGVHTLGPVHMCSGDVFGLFQTQATDQGLDRLVVYPAIWPLEELGLPAKEPFGELKAQRRLFTDPLRTIGIRDYYPEDDLQHIHWKATAHRGALQVRTFEPAATLNVVFLLNVATFPHHWQGVLPDLFERAISVAASLATWSVGQRYRVGLVANGCVPLSDQPIRVPPGRSPGQLAALLEALAGVTSFATQSIHELLRRESPRLPWGSTLVVVTAVVTDELAAAILKLHDAGRCMVLVSLADETPPQIEGVVVHHLPPTLPAFQHMVHHRYDPRPALQAAGLLTTDASWQEAQRGQV